MTDKERLQRVLDVAIRGNIEEILDIFLYTYGNSLSIETVNDLYEQISRIRDSKIADLVTLRFVANERARYIKSYLEGKMWPDEETAKRYLQPQIDNAQAILDACDGKRRMR